MHLGIVRKQQTEIIKTFFIMIQIGPCNKEQLILDYIKSNDISKIYLFYPNKFQIKFDIEGIEIEYIEWNDIIRYVYFYRLLQEIDHNSLLVFNEIMRTQNRYELTYNCLHHYCNQTSNKIVFESYPFIEDKEDFMILLDIINKNKWKGKNFDWDYLSQEKININPIHHTLTTIDLTPTSKEVEKYNKDRDKLFEDICLKDPDTIPRQLHVNAGKNKIKLIESDKQYVARNARFKRDNITTYNNLKEKREYICIDLPHRRIDFNDFLKSTGMAEIKFINSGLKVDQYYISELNEWINRLEEFYVKSGISK